MLRSRARSIVRKVTIALPMCAGTLVVVLCVGSRASADEEVKPQEIPFEHLESGRVQIVGRLGKVIGTAVRVSGTWEAFKGGTRTKNYPSPVFTIDTIDGRTLKTRVVFDRDHISMIYPLDDKKPPEIGTVGQYIVVETLYYVGFSKEAGPIPIQVPGPTGYHSRLMIVRPAPAEIDQKPVDIKNES
jgi:hypothetical protein